MTGVAIVLTAQTIAANSIFYEDVVLQGSCTLGGSMTVFGSLNITGSLTHPLTSSAASGVLLVVSNQLVVSPGASINVDQKSSFSNSGPSTMGAYGGNAIMGPNSNYPVGSVYGDFMNPQDLGSFYSNFNLHYAGGRISIQAESAVISGTLSARGLGSASGGSINIQITGGTPLLGDGLLDVSVSSTQSGFNTAGGGRIAISGYTTISPTMLRRVNLAGGGGAGCGTLYLKSVLASAPELVVSCENAATQTLTPINLPSSFTAFDSITVAGTHVRLSISVPLIVGSVQRLSGSRLVVQGSTGLTVLRGPLNVVSSQLVVSGGLDVRSSVNINAQSTLDVAGTVYVDGNFIAAGSLAGRSGGAMVVTQTLTSSATNTISAPLQVGNLILEANSLVLNSAFTSTSLVSSVVSGTSTLSLNARSSFAGSLEVTRSATLIIDAPVLVSGSLSLAGIGTHDLTSNAGSAFQLSVGDLLAIPSSGRINVNQKSSFSNSGANTMGAYGGNAIMGPNSNYPVGSVYGDFMNPQELGSFYNNYDLHYAGGRVSIEAGQISLNGSITARGVGSASGGSVNVRLLDGGSFLGQGAIDVSVDGTSSGFNTAGGGRVAITGFSQLSQTIFNSINLNGASGGAGCGTLFLRAAQQLFGGLYVAGSRQTSTSTPVTFGGFLNDVSVINSNLQVSLNAKLTLAISTLQNAIIAFSSSTFGIVATAPTLTLFNTALTVNSPMVVDGNGFVDASSTLNVGSALRFSGNLVVLGSLAGRSSGTLTVDGQLRLQRNNVISTRVNVGSLLCSSGTITINDFFYSLGDVVVASGSTLRLSGGGLVRGSFVIQPGATLVQNGALQVFGNLVVLGTVTHDLTSSPSSAIIIRVVGQLQVARTGQINADQKSSFSNSGANTMGAYGGSAIMGPNSNYPVGSVYGDFMNPQELGSFYNNYDLHYAGGRIALDVGSASINGSITALGLGSASGGSINIAVRGGPVLGAGRLDVSVAGTSSGFNTAGGGRIAITGYSQLSDALYLNIVVDGASGSGGCGTLFLRADCLDAGGLHINAITPTSATTPVTLVGTLSFLTAFNSAPTISLTGTVVITSIGRLVSSSLRLLGSQQLTIHGDVIVDGSSLSVQPAVDIFGSLQIVRSGSVALSRTTLIDGNLLVVGTLTQAAGSLAVSKSATFQTSNTLAMSSSFGDLTVSAGSGLSISGSLTVGNFVSIVGSGTSLTTRNGGSISGNLSVGVSSTLTTMHPLFVGGDVLVDGLVTHEITSNQNAIVNLIITGSLTISSSGRINVDQKSSFSNSGASTMGAYGGSAIMGPNSNYPVGSVYGDFMNPQELGSFYNNYDLHYAGGAVRIVASAVLLEGIISARGVGSASGGSVNIRLTNGALLGRGSIAVNVATTNSGFNTAGGGRIAITGYTVMSATVSNNIFLEGAPGLGGCGTLFRRSATQIGGELLVNCRTFASASTPLQTGGSLDYMTATNAVLSVSLSTQLFLRSFGPLSNARVTLSSHPVVIESGGLTLAMSSTLNVPQPLTIRGPVVVGPGSTLNGDSTISIDGPLTMSGSFASHSGGMITILGLFTSSADNSISSPVTSNGLVCTGGTLTITGSLASHGDVIVNGGTLRLFSASIFGSLSVTTGATLIQNGLTTVQNAALIAGLVTHDLTSDRTQGVLINILGALNITSSGQINVDQKSSFSNSGPSTMGAYGGSAIMGPNSNYPVGSVYGDFTNPQDLGSFYNNYDLHYAGGRVQLWAASAIINGVISARGVGSASGGSINIQLNGGTFSGMGRLDVTVSSTSSGFNTAGAGRIAVTGYSTATFLFSNVLAYTAGGFAGAGTFYLKPLQSPYGSLTVFSLAPTSASTPISRQATLCSISSTNANLVFSNSAGRFCGTCTGTSSCLRQTSGCQPCALPWIPAQGSYIPLGSNTSELCEAGRFCTQGTRQLCAWATYQPSVGASSCLLCPNQSTTSSAGATSISACVCSIGMFMRSTPGTAGVGNTTELQCARCPAGFSCSGNNTAISCPLNTFQDLIGQSSCKQCPANSETTNVNATSINNCTCSSGFYLSQGLCIPCEAGFICTNNTRRQCPVGTFQPKDSSVSCRSCPDLSNNTASGSTTISSCRCANGYYLSPSSLTCVLCEPGFYCVHGSRLSCPLGSFQSGQGQTSCIECPTFLAQDSGTACPLSVFSCGCPLLSAPINGAIVNATDSEVVSFVCDDGFFLQGSATLTCLAAASSWSGSAPECLPATCVNALAAPANGVVSNSVGSTGQVAQYSCNPGWVLSGSSTATCLASGDWSVAQPPVCTIGSCPTLQGIANARFNTTTGFTNDVVIYTCSTGWSPRTSNGILQCLTTGSWSDTPLCMPAACTAPPVPGNGSISSIVGRTADVLRYSCDLGFTLSGAQTTTCLASGQWSSSAPSCSPNSCSPLSPIPNGRLSATAGLTGDTVHITCQQGWGLTGPATSTCDPSSQWLPPPSSCVPLPCAPLAPLGNGTVNTNGGVTLSVAQYQCNDGWTLVGSAVSSCTPAGNWSLPPPRCEANSCGDLTIANGVVVPPTARTLDIVTYSCNRGWRLSGSTTRQCLAAGSWFPSTAPTCLANPCGALLAPGNGTVSAPSGSTGDVLEYGCFGGWILAGSSTTTCQPDGTWSSPRPACVRLPCGPLTSPANSIASTLGNQISYTCRQGFEQIGSGSMTCQANGSWTGSQPSCRALPCAAPTIPANGAVSTLTGMTLDVLNYSCNPGWTIAGSPNATCTPLGVWLPTTECAPNPCSSLQPPAFGSANATTGVTNDVVSFRCSGGYRLEGPLTARCQASASWTAIPSCVGEWLQHVRVSLCLCAYVCVCVCVCV
jgi:hypothetical protein